MVLFYILNCDNHTLRYKQFKAQTGTKRFERIPCVSYKNVGIKAFCAALYDTLEGTPIISQKGRRERRPVEIAISLSHYKIWKTFLETKEDYCVVVEDDVTLHPSFVVCAQEAIHKLKGSFDVLYFWHGLWNVDEMEADYTYRDDWGMRLFKTIKLSCAQTPVKILDIRRPYTGGMVAYGLTRAYAAYLVKHFFPISMPVDDFIGSRQVRRKGPHNRHLMLEMHLGKRVQHHTYSVFQKHSVMVDTNLEDTTQDLAPVTVAKVCNGLKKTKTTVQDVLK